jgi:DNA-directed RNA polymerase subunit beta'
MRNLSDLKEFDALQIYLASKEDILNWSYGEVTKPETINYRTFKPEKDGLFDERIFGPVNDYECHCGKYKRIRYKGVICDKCGVEVTHSRVRRERMGHIKLASPAVHVWFFKGIPSNLALLLDISPRNLESIIYFSSFIVTGINPEQKAEAISKAEKDLLAARERFKKDLDKKAEELEKEFKAQRKEKEGFSAQEAELKLKQQLVKIQEEQSKQLDEFEKGYKIVQKKIEAVGLYTVLADTEYYNLMDYLDMFCTIEIGAEAIKNVLDSVDLNKLSLELSADLEKSKGQKALKISKRLKVVEGFRRASINPSRMVLDVLPVIPPDLRPMVQLDGGRFATSDLNDLYRRVINRNNRLRRLLELGAPEIIIRNEKRMLQESVDALFDSTKQRQNLRNTKGKKQLRSLADMLKGKQGRFRLNLLGKRVDYSGRSVIVNGPELDLDECGLPKEMALELFKPMVLREILARGYAPNVKSAKFVLEARGPEVFEILEEVVKGHPVLLNRQPTLWRLGIQAFYPKLIEGNAVQLTLVVTGGYNADFDGDQMSIHVPLSEKAVEEAKTIMIASNNIFKPSDGSLSSVPTKTIIFGLFFVTMLDETIAQSERVFSSKEEAMYAYQHQNILKLRQGIKVRFNDEIIETTIGRIIFNSILPEGFEFVNAPVDKSKMNQILARTLDTYPREVLIRLVDAIKEMGLRFGTASGHSVALSDFVVPTNLPVLIDEAKAAVAEIDKNYRRGLLTQQEASRSKQEIWYKLTQDVGGLAWEALEDDNPVRVLIKSKATRADTEQLKQIAGIKGLISDPTGKVVELPILGNYKHGLSGLEYFIGSRGARKGLVDKGLKTADAGYLTRRLADVAQEILIREHDCGTNEGRTIKVGEGTLIDPFKSRFAGRYLASDAIVDGKVIHKKGTLLTPAILVEIEEAKVETIKIRSVLNCSTQRGVCTMCYGVDMMTRAPVAIGTAVGIAAAQSIGEPGTQLTMRTFHTGGIVKQDITQGLPRVEELFEARTPKNMAIMSEISGSAKISINGDERRIAIIANDKSEDQQFVEYVVDPVSEILVEDGQLVEKGAKLTSGNLDLTELLRTVGVSGTAKYIVDEIQHVYASQGVSINDKHVETIVKQMFNIVRIESIGDTEFLPGEIVTRARFEEVNEAVLAVGGEPAEAKITLLGITKASLKTDSFLAAASFIQTSQVLTEAAASGKVDKLLGLKENVIIGRLIPTGAEAQIEE